ncbi:MAG: HlyD family efflux transporter periplasmic adaptor subunit [Burkholderiales bacterium]|nr:MAG: HlyD family efflux transporter periplasmic adaptor subunit [Burkholderiales bacterium]
MNDRRKTGMWRGWLWPLVLVLGVAAVLWAAYRPRPLVVEVAQVETGRFEQVLEEDGRLRLRDRYVLHAPVPGELLRPTLRVGDAVRQGQVVAELVPVAPQLIDERTRQVLVQRVGSADAARQAALAQEARAEAALSQARSDAGRARRLADAGFTSAAAREQAEQALVVADQAVRAAQAQRRSAEFGLAEARAALAAVEPAQGPGRSSGLPLRSPVDGLVLKLHQDSAGPVAAGQPLLDVGDTAALEAVVDVLSTEVGEIAAGAAVRLSVGAAAPALTGRVQRVEPVAFTKVSALGIEEQRVNVIVELEQAPQAGLGDGFRVEARIALSAQEGVLLVPAAALVREGTGWRVFVVEEDRARARPVRVRDRHAAQAWVDEGLSAGETVVLYPGSLVTDGQRVRLQEAR